MIRDSRLASIQAVLALYQFQYLSQIYGCRHAEFAGAITPVAVSLPK